LVGVGQTEAVATSKGAGASRSDTEPKNRDLKKQAIPGWDRPKGSKQSAEQRAKARLHGKT